MFSLLSFESRQFIFRIGCEFQNKKDSERHRRPITGHFHFLGTQVLYSLRTKPCKHRFSGGKSCPLTILLCCYRITMEEDWLLLGDCAPQRLLCSVEYASDFFLCLPFSSSKYKQELSNLISARLFRYFTLFLRLQWLSSFWNSVALVLEKVSGSFAGAAEISLPKARKFLKMIFK